MHPEALLINTVLSSWNLVIDRLDKSFSSLSDEELQREVAPGRNRVYYLLGHLTAVHDRLFPLLRLGDRLHPELDEEFITQPDRKASGGGLESSELRRFWFEVNSQLTKGLESLRPEQWLERHASVSEADFANEPLRNRLAVVLSRTAHGAYHDGQLRLSR